MATRPDYYKTLGVDKKATPRRSRRPTASSRASTTPTATPTTRRPRSASRRSPRRTTCSATPRSASSTTAAPGRSPPARPRRRLRRLRQLRLRRLLDGRHPLQPVRRRGERRACAPAPARRARRRPRGQVSITFDQAIARRAGPAPGADARHLPDLPRHRREARHHADRVPALRGPRHRDRGPGHVLDLPALLALRRRRHGHRGPVPDVPGHRRRAHGQAPAREHPRRRARRQPHPPRRARASRVAAAARPATST